MLLYGSHHSWVARKSQLLHICDPDTSSRLRESTVKRQPPKKIAKADLAELSDKLNPRIHFLHFSYYLRSTSSIPNSAIFYRIAAIVVFPGLLPARLSFVLRLKYKIVECEEIWNAKKYLNVLQITLIISMVLYTSECVSGKTMTIS